MNGLSQILVTIASLVVAIASVVFLVTSRPKPAKTRAISYYRSVVVIGVLVAGVLAIASGCNRTRISTTHTNLEGYVGQPLRDSVEVLVKAGSTPVEGAAVLFLPKSNHGTASPVAVATDSAGRAKTNWTLGREIGEQRLVATLLGGDSVWISADATARPDPVPTRIKITPDSARLGFVGDIAPFSAEILDQYGDPVSGSVTWSSQKQCVFRAGSYGFAMALAKGTDSIVAEFDGLRATALVKVDTGAR